MTSVTRAPRAAQPHPQETVRKIHQALRRGNCGPQCPCRVPPKEGTNALTHCPTHNDRSPSLSIRAGRDSVLLHCFSGCSYANVKAELQRRNLWQERIVFTYPSGNRHTRTEKPGTEKTVEWNKGATARGELYGAPKLAELPPGETVLVAEGEQATIAAWSYELNAVGTACGASSTPIDTVLEALRGFRVVLCPDNDKPGFQHMRSIGHRLTELGIESCWLELPDLPEKGDIADWTGGADALQMLIDAAPAFIPDEDTDSVRALIQVKDMPPDALASRAWEAIRTQYRVVRTGSRLALIEEENGLTRLDPMSLQKFEALANSSATYYRGQSVTALPQASSRLAYELPPQGLPRVDVVVHGPVVGRDGEIIQKGIYQPASLLVAPIPALAGLTVPAAPSPAQVAVARSFLRDELLRDFPFQDGTGPANAIAAMLTPLLRPVFSDLSPLFVITASVRGSGKTTLAKLILLPSAGHEPAAVAMPPSGDELKRTVLGVLRAGQGYLLFDNLTGHIDYPQLDAYLTSETIQERLLHSNDLASYHQRLNWVATGNNVSLSPDTRSRSVFIRLVPDCERPEMRDFRHPDIERWALSHLREISEALLTLCAAWVADGMPRARVKRRYQSWAEIVGGVLEVAGIEGFLANDRDEYDFDPTTEAWNSLINHWHLAFGSQPVKVRDLYRSLAATDLVPDRVAEKSANETMAIQALGRELRGQLDRIFGDLRLSRRRNNNTKSWEWYVEPVHSQSPMEKAA